MLSGVPVIGLGAGGHGAVLVEALRACGGWHVVGLLDPRRELWGTEVLGVPVLGDDDLLGRTYDSGVQHAFVGLGSTSDTRAHRRLYEAARAARFTVVTAVHPAAVVAPSARLAQGVAVLAGAVVGTRAHIGENAIVNTAAVVEHDCAVGAHAHVATGARLGGAVEIGEGAHVGIGSTVLQGVRIGAGAVVGGGAVVLRDVQPGAVVAGVPARPLRGAS